MHSLHVFADFSVNSWTILMKFHKDYFWVTRQLQWNFHETISVHRSRDLKCKDISDATSCFSQSRFCFHELQIDCVSLTVYSLLHLIFEYFIFKLAFKHALYILPRNSIKLFEVSRWMVTFYSNYLKYRSGLGSLNREHWWTDMTETEQSD